MLTAWPAPPIAGCAVTDGGTIALLIVLAAVALVAAYWLLRLASLLLTAFAYVVVATPWWIVVPGFIIFPPAFVAFLLGLVCLVWEMHRADTHEAAARREAVASGVVSGASADCRALGYDE